jgi:cation diffusion facilitator CzcD-associated flavoprotein CzcO
MTMRSAELPDQEVIVVGAGFAGIGAGIELKRAGIEDFVLLERACDIGGTWRDNTYPGLAVDIPSFTYSFAFEPKPDWSRVYAPGPEIKAYADHCADKYDIRRHVRLNSTVAKAEFNPEACLWQVTLGDGATLTGRYLLSCQGALTTPSTPAFEGMGDFEGVTMHTARWDHEQELRGKRVAVIGTGATALQLIPEIAPIVERLEVFQRTPIWVFPKRDRALPGSLQRLFQRLPVTQRAARLVTSSLIEVMVTVGVVNHGRLPRMVKGVEAVSLRHLHKQVSDPELRKKLTPQYGFGCKRPSFSNEYWRTFTRPNVGLRTEGIERINKTGILTKDGREHPVDVLILATGFKVFDISFPIVGANGVELTRFWSENRRQSYEGSTLPGFPNFFLVPGPYGNVGLSWFQMIDTQIRHAMRVIGEARRRRATRAEVKQEAHDRYFQWAQHRMPHTVFLAGNCGGSNSYYFDEHGDAPWQRPSSVLEARWRSRRFDLNDYEYDSGPGK